MVYVFFFCIIALTFQTFLTAIVVALALKGVNEQGRKHPLDTPKSVIERREREGEIHIEREGEIHIEREGEIER